MSRTLYAISDDMAALDAILTAEGGDISSPDALAALDAWEAELAADLTGKVDAYCSLIAEMDARSTARAAEAARLTALAKRDASAAGAMRERLRYVWETRGLGRVETDRYSVSLAKNGGKQALVIRDGFDASNLPAWAIRSTTTVDIHREAIRDRLDDGEVLEFAAFAPRGNSIRIK